MITVFPGVTPTGLDPLTFMVVVPKGRGRAHIAQRNWSEQGATPTVVMVPDLKPRLYAGESCSDIISDPEITDAAKAVNAEELIVVITAGMLVKMSGGLLALMRKNEQHRSCDGDDESHASGVYCMIGADLHTNINLCPACYDLGDLDAFRINA